jgi:hypothetical protein
MFASIGAVVFFSAACFSLVVMTRMVRGYWPLIIAALNNEPLPRTMASAPSVAYRRRATVPVAASYAASSFTPRRLSPARAAA